MGKFSIAVAALAATAAAFPAVRGPEAKRLERRQAQLERVAKRDGYHSGKGTVPDTLAVFDAKSQYISNQGKYKFVPPGPTDQRGPCPGLNAMANHNYLPHNGIATITQYIEATNKVYGMGLDLGGFLSVYGAIFNGDLLKFSMGGPDPRVSLGLLGFDKQPIGLSGSHNNYESDVSPIRGDLYQYGDGYTNQVEQFAQLWAYQDELSNEESNFNLEILQDFRSKRWDDSLYKNPDFFSAIFAGVLVQPAAFTFMYRFLANHSAEYPDGQLTQNILKEFWAISGPDESGKFTNKHGWERIPDNWYRRTIGDDYTIPFFLLDVIQEATVYPKFLSLGGNVNGTNTFVGVDPGDLTKGVFNAKNLLEGNNLQCFIFQFLFQDAPDFLFGLTNDVTHAVTLLTNAISNATVGLDCPQLEKPQITDQFDKFPGYKKSKGMGRPEGPLTGLVSGLGSILGGGH